MIEEVGNQIRSAIPARGEKAAEGVPCLTRAWKRDEARDKWPDTDRHRKGKAMSRYASNMRNGEVTARYDVSRTNPANSNRLSIPNSTSGPPLKNLSHLQKCSVRGISRMRTSVRINTARQQSKRSLLSRRVRSAYSLPRPRLLFRTAPPDFPRKTSVTGACHGYAANVE